MVNQTTEQNTNAGQYLEEYERWKQEATEDQDIVSELHAMASDEAAIEDAFYKNLSFGTGGLRGVIGAGTNRMNIYTVRKASQGLSNYLNEQTRDGETPVVVIARDSRIKSDIFALAAAGVFAANGIKVHVFEQIIPTPLLSYAVRELHASAGIVITASHNPAKYNGYKVYGSDGCQITTETAKAIQTEIEKVDVFSGVRKMAGNELKDSGLVFFVGKDIIDGFTEAVKAQSVLYADEIDRNVDVVYSPLNGTGLEPVTRVLREAGFGNITIVEEQREPDGHFPTCPKPNPEEREAMELGLEYCRRVNADLLLATDPDCDRCGIAVKAASGEYRLLSANETGILLLEYICSQRKKHGRMPSDPVFAKTIVTNDLAERIAAQYGVKTVNTLTGFKFIGEVIGNLEEADRADDFIFAFEESYGYLAGTYARDKDGVVAAYLIVEMFAFYKTRGISLLDKLEELYKEYGYCLNTQHSYSFEGSAGMEKMQKIMEDLRGGLDHIGGKSISKTLDYRNGIDDLPPSNVLKFLIDGGSVVVRPSGTEPKLKVYYSVTADSEDAAQEMEEQLAGDLEKLYLQR